MSVPRPRRPGEQLDHGDLRLARVVVDHQGGVGRVVVGEAEPLQELLGRAGPDEAFGPVGEVDGLAQPLLQGQGVACPPRPPWGDAARLEGLDEEVLDLLPGRAGRRGWPPGRRRGPVRAARPAAARAPAASPAPPRVSAWRRESRRPAKRLAMRSTWLASIGAVSLVGVAQSDSLQAARRPAAARSPCPGTPGGGWIRPPPGPAPPRAEGGALPSVGRRDRPGNMGECPISARGGTYCGRGGTYAAAAGRRYRPGCPRPDPATIGRPVPAEG